MFRILDRYIFREIAQSWLAVTLVLLAILLTNQFARVLGDVAKDKLPKDAIFQIIGLTALQYLTILVPIALFLAIMLALGRLYRDSDPTKAEHHLARATDIRKRLRERQGPNRPRGPA